MSSKILEYTRVRPLSVSDSYKMFKYFFTRKRTMREDDENYVRVKYNGMVWNLRYSMLDYDLGILLGTHEYSVLRWINFKDLKTFVDAGAYIGTYTLRAGKAGAYVYSFEPNPFSYRLLKKNVTDNNLTERVQLYNMALFDKSAEMNFSVSSVGSSLFGSNGTLIKVKTITLDSLEISNVDLLKIDVEDAEINVIRGATKTLENTREILIEVRKQRINLIEGILKEKGFKELKRTDTSPTTTYILYNKVK
ncbi:FkbM family methyltransferase [Stygiolobus caldivivus]|uniref:Methyltransferase FkbM domain-containing protein n=1 Tax=Stygiolobus caldivivus TaxID=2824673 RepID=A0A8D5U5J9_9CREN|nr:FkbM family methyltransferase [Stygiolobus caldivivus]BCU69709.1 hypothetical protein KN1_10060 [Stygiolobus caldivivus]